MSVDGQFRTPQMQSCLRRWFSSGHSDTRSVAVLERERYVLWHPSTGYYSRYMAIIPCIVAQLVLGSFYSTSVFNKPNDTQIWKLSGVNSRMFIACVASYGLSSFLLGNWVQRNGVFASLSRSLFLTPLGWAAAGLAVRLRAQSLLYVYGVLHGLGCSLSYLSTTSCLAQWFPESKGFMAGVAVFGAGLGSLVWTLVARFLLDPAGYSFDAASVMFIFSAIFFVLLLLSLPFLRNPPPHFKPTSTLSAVDASRISCARPKSDAAKLSASPDRHYEFLTAVSSYDFILMALTVFATSLPGVVFLSSAADMASNLFGLDGQASALVTGYLNAVNFGGRAAWGAVTDLIGRKSFFLLSSILQCVALILMIFAIRASNFSVWLACFLIIGSLYGGGFGVLPAILAELFGPHISSATHGVCIACWAIACVVGTPIFSAVNAASAQAAEPGHVSHPSSEGYMRNAMWLSVLPALAFVCVLFLNVRREDRIVAITTKTVRIRCGQYVVVASGALQVLGRKAQEAEFAAHGALNALSGEDARREGDAGIKEDAFHDPGLVEWLSGRADYAEVK
jgi:MFS family permease